MPSLDILDLRHFKGKHEAALLPLGGMVLQDLATQKEIHVITVRTDNSRAGALFFCRCVRYGRCQSGAWILPV